MIASTLQGGEGLSNKKNKVGLTKEEEEEEKGEENKYSHQFRMSKK